MRTAVRGCAAKENQVVLRTACHLLRDLANAMYEPILIMPPRLRWSSDARGSVWRCVSGQFTFLVVRSPVISAGALANLLDVSHDDIALPRRGHLHRNN